jgi:hypothetical protein
LADVLLHSYNRLPDNPNNVWVKKGARHRSDVVTRILGRMMGRREVRWYFQEPYSPLLTRIVLDHILYPNIQTSSVGPSDAQLLVFVDGLDLIEHLKKASVGRPAKYDWDLVDVLARNSIERHGLPNTDQELFERVLDLWRRMDPHNTRPGNSEEPREAEHRKRLAQLRREYE